MDLNSDDVKELIKSTYFTQRQEINHGAGIKNFSQEWPFLFKEVGMAAHFQELSGVSLIGSFLASVDKKRATSLKLLQTNRCAERQMNHRFPSKDSN